MEAHYRACLYAGVKIAGTNAEVMPAQVRKHVDERKNLVFSSLTCTSTRQSNYE